MGHFPVWRIVCINIDILCAYLLHVCIIACIDVYLPQLTDKRLHKVVVGDDVREREWGWRDGMCGSGTRDKGWEVKVGKG